MRSRIPEDVNGIGALQECGICSAVIAIGIFDGVHRGHQKLLTELLVMAKKLQASPAVMTFYPHPRSLLTDNPPKLLVPPSEKSRLLRSFGIEAVVTLPFTPEFSRLSPLQFLEKSVFAGPVPVKGICIGKHWRFGAKAAGNSELLEKLATERNFRFSAVDELCLENGQVVSSTSIRNAISVGDFDTARIMLGRHYALFGHVEHGYHIAGEKLNTPTANLKISFGVLPPYGVYAAYAYLESGEILPAAVNIGVSPSFRKQYGVIEPRVEVHLLDASARDLYDTNMKLELRGFVRRERTFPDTDSLKRQIVRDIAEINTLLERR